jgi:hypothetical protein
LSAVRIFLRQADNRDAGVILESEEIAQYFGPIFDADWAASRALVGSRKAATGRSCEERQAGCKKGEESGQKASEEVILSLC